MDHRIGWIFLSLVAAILFFMSVSYPSWPCKDAILGPLCYIDGIYYTVGILLICAGVLTFFTAILIIYSLVEETNWAIMLSAALVALGSLKGLAALFYYATKKDSLCPYIAALGVGFITGLFTLLSFEYSE